MPVHPCANIVASTTQMPIIATSTQMPTRFPEKILGGIFSSEAETIAHQPIMLVLHNLAYSAEQPVVIFEQCCTACV